MKVAVTGAGGYIGRFVVKTLVDQGHEVVAIDFVHQGIDERAKICDVNIFSGEPDVYEKMGCPDSVIHLAWKDGFVHNSNAHMDNLSSHYKFLRNLVDAGCKNISVMGTMHEIGFYEGKIDENAEKAGLVWLAKQQGYTLDQVVEVLKDGDIAEPKTFLETMLQEVANGYGCEALTFCVKMTLGQAIALKEKMESNPNGSIVLDKRATCGLFNPWDGSGSILDISCEKDIEIPFENIWKFYIDEKRSNRYDSIHNVYGTDSSLWKDYLKEIKA